MTATGCADSGPLVFGQEVDLSAAVPLSTVMTGGPSESADPVTVSGTIGVVCRTAGCWFVLEDQTDDRLVQLLVDLQRDADFTLPGSVVGRRTVVHGRLEVIDPDELKLHASGMVIE